MSCPRQLRTPEGRRQALAEAKRRIAERKGRAVSEERDQRRGGDGSGGGAGRGPRRGGRREWLRVARRELERTGPGRRSRSRVIGRTGCSERSGGSRRTIGSSWPPTRPMSAGGSTARDTIGRVLKGNSKPYTAPELPEGTINLSDPDSQGDAHKGTAARQAYNAQAAVNEQQIVLAAEITIDAPDFGHLEPMLDTTLATLERHGVTERPEALLADAGTGTTDRSRRSADSGSRC